MIEELLQQVLQEAPVLAECVQKEENSSLWEYCSRMVLKGKRNEKPLEYYATQDIGEAVKAYLFGEVGEQLAEQVGEQVKKQRILLTANHHEVEFCVQSVQGNILYAHLLEQMGYKELVPIFSNTTINMSNENYPRGLMTYHTNGEILKLPVFPFKERNTLIAVARSFTEEMVQRTWGEIIRYEKNGTLTAKTADTLRNILESCYLNQEVLRKDTYAKQVLYINRMLGKKIISDTPKEFLYIEMEEISSRLLRKDLENKEQPLLKDLMFEPGLTEKLISALDKKTGCWETGTRRGTFLFWGVDERRRRFSLSLKTEGERRYLWGMDMEKKEYSYSYDEESIVSALEEKRLIPGLFLTFFELHLTRDYILAGGCFQSEYLKDMCQGLLKVLETEKGYEMAVQVLKKKESIYLSGPMFLLGRDSTGYPMGTVEILERGGITMKEISESLKITIRRSHEIGLFNFYPDLIPASKQKDGWWKQLSREVFYE